ncbi:hypothetical protein ABE82_26265 (plasmid) [Paenibacillus peoriae]|uniref:hypothetical protein n=1 Tax=Paenibacillus peoriae TaxID=59893 RepID=UPI0007220E65|nr:hypothetical protein [Paenibacillus peoriae]ALS09925.1 hypothetical protein ABE82_26265 [Paenibacillus peoriae]
MNKKSVFSGLLSLFMFFSLLTSVGAQASNEVDQGIIPALSDASSVNESTLDEHLQEMGFETTEISTLPIEMKRDISSKDGKKVAAQEVDTTVTITDEEGNTVTDQAATNQLAASATPTISGYAVYSGTSNNGRERIYQVYATYRWASSPLNFYTDNLAMAWQSNATPTGTPNGQHTVDGNTYSSPVDKEEVSGTAWFVDIKAGGSSTVQSGWGRQELRYATSSQGINTAIAVGYSHRNLPGNDTEVNLGFGVVSFGGIGKTDYTGRFNFTI